MNAAVPQTSESFKNTVAFFIFGFITYCCMFGVNYAAAEDVLSGTKISTSVVYMCDVVPYFLGSLILPMFLHVPPLLSVILACLLDTVGIVLVAVKVTVETKLIGVIMIALADSFSNVRLLSMTTFYEEITSRAYAAGTGFGSVFGVLYYTGMTTWFCVSMENTLLLIAWLPLLFPVFYGFMDKKHNQVSKTTTHQDIPYSPLNASSHEEQARLTYKQKFQLIWHDMPLALSIYAGFLGRALVPQAVLTTVVFSDAPFSPRDHYQYYLITLVAGDLLGKSYGMIVLLLKCKLPQYTRHTWVFASLIVTFVVFLVCVAWFRFLHQVWIVILICFLVGLCAGVLFDFTYAAANGEPNSLSKEFSRAILMFPYSVGIVCASFLGMYIEPLLNKRCEYVARNATECLARIIHNERNANMCLGSISG